MNTYHIAGLSVNMEPMGRTALQAEKYLAPFTDSPDITVTISERAMARFTAAYGDADMAYYMVSGFRFYRQLIPFHGFMLHASALETGGKAYLFSGQSGIGKSTHVSHWQSLLGEKCRVINDDKPAIRLMNGAVYACGTPWSGKHDKSENVIVPLGSICFVNRGEQNEIKRLEPRLAALRLIDQSTKGVSEEQWDALASMIERIVNEIPVYELKCVNDISAARLSASVMTGEQL